MLLSGGKTAQFSSAGPPNMAAAVGLVSSSGCMLEEQPTADSWHRPLHVASFSKESAG